MTDETKQETTEVTETISEETMEQINQEVEKVEQGKIDAVKEAVTTDLDSLRKELEAIKAQNAAADKKRQDEAEAAKLRAELDAERAKLEAPVKKHIVPQDSNPVQQNAPKPVEQPKLSQEQEWAQFEKNFSRVSVTLKK